MRDPSYGDFLAQVRELRATGIREQTPVEEFRAHPDTIRDLKAWVDKQRPPGAEPDYGLRWSSTNMLLGIPLKPDETLPVGVVLPWPQGPSLPVRLLRHLL